MNVLPLAFAGIVSVAVIAGCGGDSSEGDDVEDPAPSYSYSHDAPVRILALWEWSGQVTSGEERDTPLVSVYGDGRVVVRFPELSPRSGEYETRIGRAELDALVGEFMDNGFLQLSEESIREEKRQIIEERQAAQPEEPVMVLRVADAATSALELRLESYRAPGEGRARADLSHRVSWYALDTDARQFPESERLARLVALRDRLKGLSDAENLRKIE